ncbi:hypothetical protein MELB17_09913 [Marinobacter sp. ELB17]|nr:hypothetical protein MELB17_09913 [Marinobacter sp. ELB17]
MEKAPVATKLARQLKKTLDFVKNTALRFEPETTALKTQTLSEFETVGQERPASTRAIRHRLMESLNDRIAQVENMGPSDATALAKIHTEHQGLAHLATLIASQDVSPCRTEAFIATDRGQKALQQLATEARRVHPDNQKSFRLALAKSMAGALAENLYEHLEEQFPPRGSKVQVMHPADRDILTLGKDLMAVIRHQGRPVAAGIVEYLEAGIDDDQFELGDQYLTETFWNTAIAQGFDKSLDSFSELTASVRLQDQISATDALKLITDQMPALFDKTELMRNPSVTFIESDTKNQMAALKRLGHSGENTTLVVPDENGQPIAITPKSSEMPDTWMAGAPGKRLQVIKVSPDMDAFERLHIAQEAINDSAALKSVSDFPNAVKQLYQQWRDLPTNDKGTLRAGLDDIQYSIRQLTATQAPPGFGDRLEGQPLRDLVTLSLLASTGASDRTPLPFSLPRDIATIPSSQPPAAEVCISETESGIYKVDWRSVMPSGEIADESYRRLRDIPSGQVPQEIDRISAEHNESFGLTQPNIPGLATYDTGLSGKSQFVGHWLSDQEKEQLTQHTPAKLMYRDARGEAYFRPDDSFARSPEDAATRSFAIVEMVHGGSITEEQTSMMMEFAEFDGDYLLDASGEDMVGAPKFRIDPILCATASDIDMKTVIVQKIALSDASTLNAAVMINRVNRTPWGLAHNQVQDLMSGNFDDTAAPSP